MSDGTGREPDTDSEISPQEDDLTGEVLDREGFVLCDANIVAFLFPSTLVVVDRRYTMDTFISRKFPTMGDPWRSLSYESYTL